VEEKTQELENAHQRMILVEKMASLGKLAAVVAHEINNPLAGIRTYVRLLRKRWAKSVAAGQPGTAAAESGGTARDPSQVLELVESEAERCGEIVRNLLLFSRTPGVRFAETEIGPLVERCALLVRHQAELKEVVLTAEVAPGLPQIQCDASQIQQMLLALAMNAIEATASGGSVTLAAAGAPEGTAEVLLTVADTGTGIAAEDQGRIFEPFFTTKEEGSGAGVGLGLAVVYGIVRRHHGRIEVESEIGRGTQFKIHLPLTQPVRDEDEEASHDIG
jgi:two-component system NtrC family sensor kinase